MPDPAEQIEFIETVELSPSLRGEILSLCDAAYEEATAGYLSDIGTGIHLLLRDADGRLASHLMLVERQLQPAGLPPLRTAYVELVATEPALQRRGFATALLREVPRIAATYQLAALSPSDRQFYARLGWESWRGPLHVRTERGLLPTPDEEVMILRLPSTPPCLDLTRELSVEWRAGEVW